ncbi:hypothetical protein Syn7502_02526 [Synechococcus sp. PCC 7502]|uniref:hypothetical protein n=1 Tax=Synechococcus sp. PCC 7502 TaxID=1173263 RepID=UPI00029FDD32|nr:hypothetical protein [Synechococcus sp. PCC 7502]AFY74498.1 hypothetical protein Syn7502_02526 [Synechococcus sp. PCC 7502]
MTQLEKLLKLAEDELVEYSTKARKIEKLRRKIGLTVTKDQRQAIQAELLTEMQPNSINKLVAEQRQTVALPFWGIAGLGLLLSISFNEPLGLLAAGGGALGAIALQKWGWELQAKLLLLETFAEIEALSNQ